jgi:hypothetical protein
MRDDKEAKAQEEVGNSIGGVAVVAALAHAQHAPQPRR